jgi:6,7-dimethyl-8-ribityllumazine synthase
MSKDYQGMLTGEGLKFGIVVSRFNEIITGRLIEGARDSLLRHGVSDQDIDVAWTPGSMEIPLAAKTPSSAWAASYVAELRTSNTLLRR